MPEKRDVRSELYGRLTRGAPLAVLVAAALLIAYKALPVLKLIAVSMLVAVVFRTIVRVPKRLGVGPWLSAMVLLVVIGVFGALVGLVIVPNLIQEYHKLSSQLPSYLDSLTNLAKEVPFIPDPSGLMDRLQSLFSQLIGSLPSFATSLAWIAGAVVAVLFLGLYMSIRPGPLVSAFLWLVPEDRRERVREVIQTIEERLQGWIVGTALISSFVGGGAGIGLWILGVPLPVTFGLIAGVLNVIPYLGSTVGALLPALLALTISFPKALYVVALFIILNQIEGNILQPMVMGREIQLHPAVVLMSFLIMGALLGLVGALLAVPTAVVLTTLAEELSPEEREAKKDSDPK